MAEPVYECCEHCEATVPHDPIWKALDLPHTTPCRKPHGRGRYFTLAERLTQPPVSSTEPMPSPSMYDELLRPLWWTPNGLVVNR